MNKIIGLTDYKNRFGSKWESDPYRSGYDKALLKKYFEKYGFEVNFKQFSEIEFRKHKWEDTVVIYTSSEEKIGSYKSYIGDIILGLKNMGAHIIPRYDFLRAHDNKVFMELLKKKYLGQDLSGVQGRVFGTLQELEVALNKQQIKFPCVLKDHSGAQSKGVYKAKNEIELFRKAKKISRTTNYFYEMKDRLRKFKHQGYERESKYQNKFIVQPFIPALDNDWKILVYGDHYYILNRGIKEGDFRASGSHHNYKAGSNSEFPTEMLDTVQKIYRKLDIPHLSLDFAYNGENHYVFEIQAIYFGTSTLDFCEDYYTKEKGNWVVKQQSFDQEEEYVWGLVHYLDKHAEFFHK